MTDDFFKEKYTGTMYFRPDNFVKKFKAEYDGISVTSNIENLSINIERNEVLLPIGPNGTRISIENNRDKPISLISYKGQWVGAVRSGEKVLVKIEIDPWSRVTYYDVQALGGVVNIPALGDWNNVSDVKIKPKPITNAAEKNRIKKITVLLSQSKELTATETEFLLGLPLKQLKLLPKEVQDWLAKYQGVGSTDLPTEKIHELDDKRSIRLKD